MSIKRDSRGYMFSLDLLLALIPITIVLGMVAGDIDNMMYQVQDTVFRGSMDRVAFDTMDTLLETSGEPTNWEETGNPSVVGLVANDSSGRTVEGTIDTNKLSSLTKSDVQNLLGDDYGFFFKVTSLKTNNILINLTSNSTVSESLGSSTSSANDVVRVERVALYSHFKIVSSAKDLLRYTGTPRVYSYPPNPFQTNKHYLQVYDYWVVVVNRGYNSATVNINSVSVVDQHDFNGENTRFITITKQVDSSILANETSLMDNPVDVRGTSNPGDSLDVYIVQVPKGTPESDVNINSAVPQKVRVELYIWNK